MAYEDPMATPVAAEAGAVAAPSAEPAKTDGKLLSDLTKLGPYFSKGFDMAVEYRRTTGIEDELMQCLRQCKSEYSPEEKSRIKQAKGIDDPVYLPHADLKRRTANAIVMEIFLNAADRPWSLRPTPVPELSETATRRIAIDTITDFIDYRVNELITTGIPPDLAMEIVQATPPDPMVASEYASARRAEIDNMRAEDATERMERMSNKMHDQMVEGCWAEAMTACVDFASSYGTCVLKGPVRRMRKRNRYQNGTQVLKSVEVWEWEAINPLDCYPAKGAVGIQDGDFFQRVRFTPKMLNAMAKLGDGYYPETIRRILTMWPNGGLKLEQPLDSERRRLENDGTGSACDSVNIEGFEVWGDAKGSKLKAEGVTKTSDGEAIEDDEYYEVNSIVINREVVFCSLTDERLGRPLYKGVFYRTPGSWWGESPMKKMRDAMRMYNASAIDLCVNSAMSAGPIMAVGDQSRVATGTQLQWKPHAIFYFNDPLKRGDIPIKFIQVESNAADKMAVMERLEKLFDTVTGIPAYTHGSDTAAGAGRTYNGLLLIMDASKKGANTVVMSLFADVMKPALTYQYRVNMLFDDDEGIKGDCEVDAGGLLAILVREQSINRLSDFLNLANNPNVMKVIGERGLSELLRQYVKLLNGVNPDNVVPSKLEMERRQQLADIESQMQAMAASQAASQISGSPAVATPAAPVAAPVSQAGLPPFPERRGRGMSGTEQDLSRPNVDVTPEMEGRGGMA